MRAIIIDDERPALEILQLKLAKIERITEVHGFRLAAELLNYLETHEIDIAFLDINMGDSNGLRLAKQIKDMQPQVYIIFVTGYSEYAVDAFRAHAAGYLMKPASLEDIEETLDYVETLPVYRKEGVRMRVQCFGNFEVFVDDRPMTFSRAKTKELFAYLIDRNGASCNGAALCAVLWEDDGATSSKKSQLRTLLSELNQELEKAGLKDVLIKGWNSYAVNPQRIDCDYYAFLQAAAPAVNQYHGEYMTQYSWAEFTTGYLERNR